MRSNPLNLSDFAGPEKGDAFRVFERFGDTERMLQEAETAEKDREQEAYERGLADGVAQEKAAADARAATALADALNDLRADLGMIRHDLEREYLGLIRQVFVSLLPHASQTAFPHEAAQFIQDLIQDINAGGDVVRPLKAYANPGSVDALRPLLDEHGHGYVDLFEDETLDPAQLHVSWGDGGASMDIDAAVQEILTALDQALSNHQDEVSDE